MTFKSPREAIQQLLATPGVPVPVDTNPMAKTLGAVLQVAEPEGGALEVRFTPDECFVQGAGVLQGGIVSAMLDFAMAFAGFGIIPQGKIVSTVNLSVNFMRPAPQGRFTCFAEIERCGLNVVFARARLVDASGRLVASGTSALSILDLPAAAPVATLTEATA